MRAGFRVLLTTELFLWFCSFGRPAAAQNGFLPPADRYRPERLRTVVISEAVTGAVVSTGLYFLWYRKHPRSAFHFFNDNAEWLQMDKVGHLTTAYNVASIQYDLMRWCGVRKDPSLAVASATALGYMSIIEVFDGFSSKWGFSKGDMLANLAGAAIFAAQQRGWGEQRIAMKFSFHGSIYPKYYPEELGKSWLSRIVKDYNGQTYWLSVNVKSFLPAAAGWPAWLNLSAGYGAEGMIGARSNPAERNGVKIPVYPRYRQFYFAPDADLWRIPSRAGAFNAATWGTRFLKVPAPALEWSPIRGLRAFPLFY